jgi:hypothetical protein
MSCLKERRGHLASGRSFVLERLEAGYCPPFSFGGKGTVRRALFLLPTILVEVVRARALNFHLQRLDAFCLY